MLSRLRFSNRGIAWIQTMLGVFAPRGSVHGRLKKVVTNIDDEKEPVTPRLQRTWFTGAHVAIPTCYRTSLIKNQKSFQNGRIRTCKPSLSAWF